MVDEVKAWFKHSTTILWARLQVAAGVVLATLVGLAGDPNIAGAVQSALQPRFIPYYVIAIGLITELARRRTAGNS